MHCRLHGVLCWGTCYACVFCMLRGLLPFSVLLSLQVHKNGHWGWQSACCTNSVSQYPLPVHPNKSHGRIPGRRMTASTFLKLVEHLAANKPGFDPLQEPLDLAPYWQKHGAGPFSAQGSQPQGSPTGRSQREACSLDSLGWTTSDIYRS